MISKSDIVAALRASGIEPGMTVFSHSNIAFFGRVEGAGNMAELISIMLESFAEVLGTDGTLVLPVFTYSFGSDKKDKVFDLKNSLSNTSAMGNWLILSDNGVRSNDPMLSVVATGGKAEAMTSNIDPVCFGAESIWARLHADDAMICNLNLDSGSTYLHWVERENHVSYRSDIPMSGTVIDNGHSYMADIIYSGRALNDPLSVAKFEAYHAACIERGISLQVPLGRGQVVSQRTRSAKSFLEMLLLDQPYLLTARYTA